MSVLEAIRPFSKMGKRSLFRQIRCTPLLGQLAFPPPDDYPSSDTRSNPLEVTLLEPCRFRPGDGVETFNSVPNSSLGNGGALQGLDHPSRRK